MATKAGFHVDGAISAALPDQGTQSPSAVEYDYSDGPVVEAESPAVVQDNAEPEIVEPENTPVPDEYRAGVTPA